MVDAAGAVGAAAWSAAVRGWLTPAVLFVAMNLVIATIAVASRLMSSSSAAPGGSSGDDDEAAAGEPTRGILLRAPSFLAVDRLRSSFSFSRLGLAAAADHAQPQVAVQPFSGDDDGAAGPEPPSPQQQQQQQPHAAEAEHQREESRVERSRSEAAALEVPNNRRRRQRPRARRVVAEGELLDGHAHGEEVAVEVDARADDFIRRFREQLRLQRLDSILRYRDRGNSLRRTGTA